ncbi:MAG TPA: endonuclease III domain-containing protein [Pirellulales bacterium]|nr:endonuclease III domain-containing protein [Pirellulales bacterium]
MHASLQTVRDRLTANYGRRRRNAAPDGFAALVCALLGEDAASPRAAQVLENLQAAGVADARGLCEASLEELIEWIEPAGNARKRAERLRRLARFVVERYAGDVQTMLAAGAETLRGELLGLSGIGAETADSILLFAAGRPSFIVDLAVHRVLKRHGWIEFDADGESIKEYVESGLDRDAERLAEFHDLLALVGREHCRKTPVCEGCPLEELLPEGGPLEPE